VRDMSPATFDAAISETNITPSQTYISQAQYSEKKQDNDLVK
jgi:hypothetical protein